jgi:hypothetical protein
MNLEKSVKGFEKFALKSDDWAKAQGLNYFAKNDENDNAKEILSGNDPKEWYGMYTFKRHKGDKASDKIEHILEKELSKKKFRSYNLTYSSEIVLNHPELNGSRGRTTSVITDICGNGLTDRNTERSIASKYDAIKKIIADYEKLDFGNPSKKTIEFLYMDTAFCCSEGNGVAAKIGYYPDGKAKISKFAFDLVVRLGIGHKYVFPLSATHPDVFVSATMYTDEAGKVIREDAFLFKERKDQKAKDGIVRECVKLLDDDDCTRFYLHYSGYLISRWKSAYYKRVYTPKFLTLKGIRKMLVKAYSNVLREENAKKKANENPGALRKEAAKKKASKKICKSLNELAFVGANSQGQTD